MKGIELLVILSHALKQYPCKRDEISRNAVSLYKTVSKASRTYSTRILWSLFVTWLSDLSIVVLPSSQPRHET